MTRATRPAALGAGLAVRNAARPAALGAALALGAVLLLASPVQAHNTVLATTPAADETLTALPESFEIRTNDALLDLGGDGNGFAFLVQDAEGRYYGDGCVRVAGASMFTTPALGEPGEYTVTWQLVSADGHTLSDSYGFAWEPAGAHEPATGSAERPACGAEPGDGEPSPARSEAPDAGGEGPGGGGEASAPGVPADAWWIAGAAAAVVLAVALVLLLTRRRPG